MLNAKMIVAAAMMGLAASTSLLAQEHGTQPAQPAKPAQPTHPAHQPAPGGDKHDHMDKPGTHDEKNEMGGAKIGEAAPAFSLTDTDGKTVKLSDYKGKVVVLQWFNPNCPAVKQHYTDGANTFNDLYTKYHAKDVVFLAVNSGAKGTEGNGTDLNAKAKKDWKIEYPILLDESGATGHAYGATNTPHMYIINKEGKLVYKGAIDNGNFGKNGDKNYVAAALDEVLAGTTVTNPETKAYGCSVKYSKN